MKQIKTREATPKDCYALARIIVNATVDNFRGLVPDRILYSLSEQESARNWASSIDEHSDDPHTTIMVAEIDDAEVIGLAMVGPPRGNILSFDPGPGTINRELYSLQVNPAWRRRGIGRQLIKSVAMVNTWKQKPGMLVKVLKINPNVAFYQTMNAILLGEQSYDWHGFQTPELIYCLNTCGSNNP